MVTNDSDQMKQVMQLLGMKNFSVISFDLHVKENKAPVVNMTYYPKKMQPIPGNEISTICELVLVEKKSNKKH